MTYKRLNENIITMSYKEFTNWCNDRSTDGKWGYSEASECISAINEINKLPFWKRNKYWSEKYEFDILDRIVNKTNKIINSYNDITYVNESNINQNKKLSSYNLDFIIKNLNEINLNNASNLLNYNTDFSIYEFMSYTKDRQYYNSGKNLDIFKLVDTLCMILHYSNKYICNKTYSESYLFYTLLNLAKKDSKILYESDTMSEILYFQFDEDLIKSEMNIFEFIADYIIDNHEDNRYIINHSREELIGHVKDCIGDSDDLNIVDFTKPFLTLEIELNEDDYLLIRFPSDIRLVSFFKQDKYNTFKEYFDNNK